MKTAILYASQEGQTEKIAHYIGAGLRQYGTNVTILSMDNLPSDFDLSAYDKVLIGASIHMSQYPKHVTGWVKAHHSQLQTIPNVFFSVCMAASDTTIAGQSEAQGYITAFIKNTGWNPNATISFAGALTFEKYGFFKRLLMRQLVRIKRLDVDTTRNTEFTDWQQVDQFIVQQSA